MANSRGMNVCSSHPRGILVWEVHLIQVRVLNSDFGLVLKFLRVRQEPGETAILSDTAFDTRPVQ